MGADDAVDHGGLGHRGGDQLGHPDVEDRRDDETGTQLVGVHRLGDGFRGGHLHVLGDAGGTGVEGAPEDAGEGQHVVDLVGVVAAAGGHDRHQALGQLRADLRVGVGHGEHDGIGGHLAEVVGPDQVRGRDADEHVGPGEDVGQGAADLLGVGDLGELGLDVGQVGATLVDGALAVGGHDVGDAGVEQDLGDGDAGGAGSSDDHADVGHGLVDDLEGVLQRGQRDDRGAVLVVVEDGDVERRLEALLHLEAGRCGDVFQVHAAEDGGDALHGLDDGVDPVLQRHAPGAGVDADREGVHTGEVLEQQRLALHDRQGGLGADVAQAEHGGAVGDDGDGVLLDGELMDPVGLELDLGADAGDAGRVGHGQVVAVGNGHAGQDLDLAAIVHGEGAVADRDHHHAVDAPDRFAHLFDVLLGPAVDDQVLVEVLLLGLEALQRHDVAADVADGGGQSTEGSGLVVEPHADGHGEGGGGRDHRRDASGHRG